MTAQGSNKTIAKNTLLLYVRMIVTMVVALYTSRVILQILGENDFGIYQVVGGVVSMLSFLNIALSTGSSRFLTFEMGTNNFEKLKQTFSTTLTIHILLAILILIIAETVGLWLVYHKLVIPPEKLNAALWVYHLSILTVMISITQVPYSAAIIAHEKMDIYAYASLVEVSAKLGIVYLLQISTMDKLQLYAILICIIQISFALFYRFYCISKFKETHYKFVFDKEILKSIGRFSGWSLFASLSIALNNQGITIIINTFFGPAVVTARVVAEQVSVAANRFVQNFRLAANPQIVKRYAAEEYDESKKLLLNSTKFSYYLMFLFSLPIILLAEPLIQIWLGYIPKYTVVFLQLIMVQSLFSVFDVSFYTGLYAKGQLRENALLTPTVGFINFLLVYLLFKSGNYSPILLFYMGIISTAIIGVVIKPILLCKIVNYKTKDIIDVFIPCLKVTGISAIIPILLRYYLENNLFNYIVVLLVSVTCVAIAIFYLGIDQVMRNHLIKFVRAKIKI